MPGPYQDLAANQKGAIAAEQRAIKEVLAPSEPRAAVVTAKEELKTIRQHAEGFVETYKPGSKPGEKREKQRVGTAICCRTSAT